jgi:hypothetical protein
MATILPNASVNSNFNKPALAPAPHEIALASAVAFNTYLRATSQQIRNAAKGPAKSSIDPYPDLPRLVDIAGEKYSFDRQRMSGIELFMKPYEDFLINFGLKNGNSGDPYYYEFLVRAYLPYGVQMKVGSFSFEETKHLDDLIKLIERRISRLRESSAVNMTQTNLKRSHNAVLLKNYQSLKLFLQDWHQAPPNLNTLSRNDLLKKAETLTDKIPGVKLITTPSKQEAAKIRQNLTNLSDEKKMEMIFRLMFYALHPDKLDINILREWQTLLDWSKNAGPKDFFQELVLATKNSPKQPATPLNYLERINAHKLAQAKNQDSAVREFKESLIRLNSSEEAERTQAISSLKRLLLVLAQKNYISQNTTEVPTELAKKLDDQIIARLPASTNPLFQTLKKFYDPIYQEVINTFDSDPNFQESLNKSQEENGLLVNFLDLYEIFIKFQEESDKLKNSDLIRLHSDNFEINENLWKFLLAIIQNTNFMNHQHTLEKLSQHVLAFPNTFSVANPPLDNYTNIDKNILEEFLGITPKNQWVFFLPPFQEVPSDNSSYYDWSSATGATKVFTIGQSLETVTGPDRTGKTLPMEALRIILIVLYQKALEGRIKTEKD